ncbi:MAG: site-specific DNA-methyltransferase [Chthoniobacterales bacterium]|nr:site-specific DNA-methyltransferase [Chthoniobacterales bacterium]
MRQDKQIGLEETPEEFITRLVDVFREVRRVLKKDGTCWINMGDSYAGGGNGGGGSYAKDGIRAPKPGTDKNVPARHGNRGVAGPIKPKDLIGQPWMLAFALRADGWYLRQDIIWAKPNPMPESVTDRCTKAHEYLFLLSKSEHYYYDAEAIKEPVTGNAHARGNGVNPKAYKTPDGWDTSKGAGGHGSIHRSGREKGRVRPKQNPSFSAVVAGLVDTRNKRSVWTVATKPYKEAHFATFPPDLIKPCVLAGSRPGDVILDPFAGSGTTGAVALELGRSATLIELNPDYVRLIAKRCGSVTPGLPLSV